MVRAGAFDIQYYPVLTTVSGIQMGKIDEEIFVKEFPDQRNYVDLPTFRVGRPVFIPMVKDGALEVKGVRMIAQCSRSFGEGFVRVHVPGTFIERDFVVDISTTFSYAGMCRRYMERLMRENVADLRAVLAAKTPKGRLDLYWSLCESFPPTEDEVRFIQPNV